MARKQTRKRKGKRAGSQPTLGHGKTAREAEAGAAFTSTVFRSVFNRLLDNAVRWNEDVLPLKFDGNVTVRLSLADTTAAEATRCWVVPRGGGFWGAFGRALDIGATRGPTLHWDNRAWWTLDADGIRSSWGEVGQDILSAAAKVEEDEAPPGVAGVGTAAKPPRVSGASRPEPVSRSVSRPGRGLVPTEETAG